MDILKMQMKNLIEGIDRMHKKDSSFNIDRTRKMKKRAEKILFHIERCADQRFIQVMVNSLEKI